eukprot:snap_masked-scaffold11_size778918-processed-gene-6.28 protein:Tk03692 transcript:snap_masked-scaffold11_size778918-processed-gene-6.28-mRNA-1 annotation:"ablim "
MCTVLQQHLNQTNGFGDMGDKGPVSSTPHPSSSMGEYRSRTLSPVSRMQMGSNYSYLQDVPNLKRPIDPYDRKISTPTMHFHIPSADRASRQTRSSYLTQLMGRRSRSHSRTGMRVLVEQIQSSTPRARSPHMNNEEPINLSHYPDGRAPEENGERELAIERDDFPAPPFAYTDAKRRRHFSEPSRQGSSRESTPVMSSDEEEAEEFHDEKLEKSAAELMKIESGMGKVFLTELAVEKERRKNLKHKYIDPRSAARTPAANKEPHFRLRYESPINASPSRIADHLRPWDDEIDGSLSRRSNPTTPFMPQTPAPPGRVVSPINPIRPGYTQKARTLPSRFSPVGGYDSGGETGGPMGNKTYSTDFSSNKSDNMSDKSGGPIVHAQSPVNGFHHHSSPPHENIRISTTYTQGLQAATPRSVGTASPAAVANGIHNGELNRSLPNMTPLQAPNIYPLHLLFTTNYRLPGDVDRCALEKHLSDAEFDMVFRMSREDFYKLPYWKRCDLKRKYHMF